MKALHDNIMIRLGRHARIVKYIISGGTAATVNIFFIFVFTDIFNIWYLYSGILSFLVAFCVSFMLQKFWTFRDHSTENVHVQASIYLVVSVINLLWNTLLLFVFVEVFHIWYLLAQVFAGGIVALSSFFVYKTFIFKNPHP